MKCLAAIIAALAPCLLFVMPGHGAFFTNTIQSFSFNPPTRIIAAGDTVVWVNLDAIGHTVTGDFEEEPICGSGFLYQGGVCMRTFNTEGTFTYHCEPHESMVGTIVVTPSENIPPTVFITSPADGTLFTGPTNVLVRAVAIAPDGEVLSVTFFDGPTALGSDTSAPFEVNANLGAGRHTLTATAFDDGGAQATSFPITVTINPPLHILKLSVGTNLVLISTPTNYLNVHPEYKTNLSDISWLALTVQSNRLKNGTVETFCGRPAGNPVFLRLRVR